LATFVTSILNMKQTCRGEFNAGFATDSTLSPMCFEG
jgi:hypothetical protein